MNQSVFGVDISTGNMGIKKIKLIAKSEFN